MNIFRVQIYLPTYTEEIFQDQLKPLRIGMHQIFIISKVSKACKSAIESLLMKCMGFPAIISKEY